MVVLNGSTPLRANGYNISIKSLGIYLPFKRLNLNFSEQSERFIKTGIASMNAGF